MKNFGRALLLLTLGLVLMSQVAMAQDALSMILPAPYSTRVGSQLIYFYEDGLNIPARGQFQSFMTIVNTSITSSVAVHFQFYQVISSGCIELFDFVDYLTPGQRHIFDPKGIRGSLFLGLVGVASEGRFIMTATPVSGSAGPSDLRALAFNWLSGQTWVNDINKSATWMVNATSRMGVDVNGGPLADGTLIDGATGFLQYFRPVIALVNSFFRTAGVGAVQAGVPFGNRLSVLTWIDEYTNTQNMYRIRPTVSATLNAFVFDNAENAFSVTPRTVVCLTEWTLAPDTVGTCSSGICSNGNFADFLGAALTSAVSQTGGWLRMRVAPMAAHQSIIGWFSQYLGTFGGGNEWVGIGRSVFSPRVFGGSGGDPTPITSSGTVIISGTQSSNNP